MCLELGQKEAVLQLSCCKADALLVAVLEHSFPLGMYSGASKQPAHFVLYSTMSPADNNMFPNASHPCFSPK